MKRSTEDKINAVKTAWKHLQMIMEAYVKRESTSSILIEDLGELAKKYERSVFEVFIQD
jgi:hypothetical protein